MPTFFRESIHIAAESRGLHEITDEITKVVRASSVGDGMCHVFIRHTSASLTIQENADPTARADLEEFVDRLVPRDSKHYRHTAEGPDDMPSHIKAALTSTSLTVPVLDGHLGLGTWQGIYLWEHRDHTPKRTIVVTVTAG